MAGRQKPQHRPQGGDLGLVWASVFHPHPVSPAVLVPSLSLAPGGRGSWKPDSFPWWVPWWGSGAPQSAPCTIPRTLMAWPKQPLPSTSPWMRSEGLKMRCGRQTTRSDSERPRSLRWEAGEAGELAPGDVSMLQRLLRRDMVPSAHLARPIRTGPGGAPGVGVTAQFSRAPRVPNSSLRLLGGSLAASAW